MGAQSRPAGTASLVRSAPIEGYGAQSRPAGTASLVRLHRGMGLPPSSISFFVDHAEQVESKETQENTDDK
jgi:hypothetical protein